MPAITAEITRLWQAADSGKAFVAALHEAGYLLAQGDKRGFCVVDAAGGVHSLARRIEGVRTKEVKARLEEIDLASLPTVAQARDQVRQRPGAEKPGQDPARVLCADPRRDPVRRQMPGEVCISARKTPSQRPRKPPHAPETTSGSGRKWGKTFARPLRP